MLEVKAELVPAIDIHGHYGLYSHAKYDDEPDARKYELHDLFMSGGAEEVIRRARAAATSHTAVSPLEALFGRTAEPIAEANRHAAEAANRFPELLQWVVIHPDIPQTFEQAAEMLRQPHCIGIKIHPETHRYPIAAHGERIFRFAAERKALLLTHSGEPNSLPDDFIGFADRYPEVSVILAHLGMGWNGDFSLQVRAIQRSKAGNVYTDTSSARSVTSNLLEWAAREIGAERMLYGTDTPLYWTSVQRSRIDTADLDDRQKHAILRGNAVRLLRAHAKADRLKGEGARGAEAKGAEAKGAEEGTAEEGA